MLNTLLFIIPILGVLWFLYLVSLLKNIKEEKDTKNQTILGSVISFLFVFFCAFAFAGVH